MTSTRTDDCCAKSAANAETGAAMHAVLINPYELGRQSFAIAHPAACLRAAGYQVDCIDLSQQKLDAGVLHDADMVAIHLGMHTATRIALAALPRIRSLAPQARIVAYGLYAPVNAEVLRAAGVDRLIGGEFEPGLLAFAAQVANDETTDAGSHVNLSKIDFVVPDRAGLPSLENYASLITASGGKRVVGFADASRGCKHLCRHCPVVPVYSGKFRIVPAEVVLADIRQQIAAGATHISFGDPDFFNGPAHAVKIVEALHAGFPHVSYDATIKVQHLLERSDLLPVLKRTGCLFITSAVEAFDDRILERLDKGHTAADVETLVMKLHEHEIALAPTFVAFTPWTSLDGYLEFLHRLVDLQLVEAVPPVQLALRLLIPQASRLLGLPEMSGLIGPFDPASLGYPWAHADARVDALQRDLHQWIERAGGEGLDRRAVFEGVWKRAHAALGLDAISLAGKELGEGIPHLSEAWYCCAEPTGEQLECI